VLADEPTGNLDSRTKTEMASIFLRLNEEFKQTFVVVSHDEGFANYAHRVLHMQDGKVSLPYKRFLGYEKGEDGLPKIVESEAKTVRMIYRLFIEGKTPSWIAARLTEDGIPTPGGKGKWQCTTVLSILENEKYSGNALLQKGFTVDFLTKKTKKNEGEVEQYFITNSHPAIVTPEVFEIVQHELAKRRSQKGYTTSGSPFSGRIICGECGGFYGSKVWHSTSKYRRTIWQCNRKYKGGENGGRCQTPHLYEAEIQKAFVAAFNKLYGDRERLMEDYEAVIRVLTDVSALDKDAAEARSECDVVMELIRKCVEKNARAALDQAEYGARYNALADRYEVAKSRLDGITAEKQARAAKREDISRFMAELRERDGLLTEFDEDLWLAMVESVTVRAAGEAAVTFKDGSEVGAPILTGGFTISR
jgi:energy-coupling factor transporter ATP-binding protein EcfA2